MIVTIHSAQRDGTSVHEQLASELTIVKYDTTSNGKLLAESKRDIKKRGLKSPDFGDAFALTFASEPATLIHGIDNAGWGSAPNWHQPLSRGREIA